MRNVNKIFVPESLSDNESGLRKMKAEAEGTSYVSFKSLADAQSNPDGVVVLEGDDGGQIYVVCPASKVKCSEQILHQLLLDLDSKKWKSPDMAHIYYEKKRIGEGIAGKGGAVVKAEIWIHKEFHGLADAIRDVIEGRRAKLN
jgi:hypothetical protein